MMAFVKSGIYTMNYYRLNEICNGLNELLTIEEFANYGLKFIKEIGFNDFIFTVMPDVRITALNKKKSPRPILVGAFNTKWRNHYTENSHFSNDYFLNNLHDLERRVHVYSTNNAKGLLSPSQQKILHEAKKLNSGHDHCLVIPMPSRIGMTSLFMCSFLGTERDFNLLSKMSKPFIEFFAEAFADSLLEKFKKPLLKPVLPKLTVRELDTLSFCALGLNHDQIGGKLGINVSTVKMHIKNCREKLQAENTIHACAKAISIGLIH